MTTSIHYGEGQHWLYLTKQNQNDAIFYGMVGLAFGNLSPMVGRVAFCITMLYLTRTDPRVRTWPIWAFIAGTSICDQDTPMSDSDSGIDVMFGIHIHMDL